MRHRRSTIGWLASLLAAPLALHAQDSGPCRHPHPLPRCATFWTLEWELARPLASTHHEQRVFAAIDSTQLVRVREVDQYMLWRLGLMRNKTTTRAFGVSGELGFSGKGVRTGVSAHARQWLPQERAIDLTAGVLAMGVTQSAPPFEIRHRLALTGSAQFVERDLLAAVLRADVAPGRRTTAAVYGGLQLRSGGALVGTVVLAVLIAAALSALSDPNY